MATNRDIAYSFGFLRRRRARVKVPIFRDHFSFARDVYRDIRKEDLNLPDDVVTVDVRVSHDEKSVLYALPKDQLCHDAAFFKIALSGRWQEADTGEVHLKDIDPGLFNMFAYWILTGAEVMRHIEDWKAEYAEYLKWVDWLTVAERQKGNGPPDPHAFASPVTVWNFERTVDAYCLGQFLGCADFQNHCIAHLYYMNLRFNHLPTKADTEEWEWSDGTVAFLRARDVLTAWEHSNFEDDAIRRFFKTWLSRYWDAYPISKEDHVARDGWDEVMVECPDLRKRWMFDMAMPKIEPWIIWDLTFYFVGPVVSSEREHAWSQEQFNPYWNGGDWDGADGDGRDWQHHVELAYAGPAGECSYGRG
ncbi:hypothetical protein BU26DRAFT_572162 [Trematosphaeria pertusa]|uniref:BTB domain-containing protein n=1 Tax=Trematosphaeria pertusa TaxID=390896 RepID=A0A6A6HSP6_9PLEO|nr:uncharacterized protein BU26DRAFT_572162 [Trematosphaeria pertusa]KAF2240919.1 hypothetical protein BU26DRAFT_572162 [Trematosphaeria pertusa]